MAKEKAYSVEKVRERQTPEITTKPLHQILEEMEFNIRAAVEAVKKTEEAAEVARGAAQTATTASVETTKRAEEARQAGEIAADTATKVAIEAAKAVKIEMLQRIESLEERLKKIEGTIPEQKTVLLREITRKEAKSEIERLFKKGKTLYYSDIAEKLRIDLELVVEICEELLSEGKVKVANGS